MSTHLTPPPHPSSPLITPPPQIYSTVRADRQSLCNFLQWADRRYFKNTFGSSFAECVSAAAEEDSSSSAMTSSAFRLTEERDRRRHGNDTTKTGENIDQYFLVRLCRELVSYSFFWDDEQRILGKGSHVGWREEEEAAKTPRTGPLSYWTI